MSDIPPELIVHRDYHEIFTGTNQEEGYEYPILEFEADTIVQILKADRATYFHYPIEASTLPISASSLVADGAIPGDSPWKADKIWKKNANYRKHIYWGDSTKPHTGLWLCAWLSGGNLDTPPVWIDRYYDPGYIAGGSFYSNSPAVYDEPSRLTLEPGVVYRYYHVGSEAARTHFNALSGGDSLQLYLHDWSSSNIDASPDQNNVTVFGDPTISSVIGEVNYTPDITLTKAGQYARVAYNTEYTPASTVTVSVWGNAKDWSNITGRDIISNQFRGGWRISYDAGFFNPIISFTSNNAIGWYNLDGRLIDTRALSMSADIVDAVIDNELITWVIDNNSKRLYSIDYNGYIIGETIFSSTAELCAIALDQDRNIAVLDTSTIAVSTIDRQHNVYTTVDYSGDWLLTTPTNIAFNLSGNVVLSDSPVSVDSNGYTWTLPTEGLHRDTGNIYTTTTYADITGTQFVIDKSGVIWVVAGTELHIVTPNNDLNIDPQVVVAELNSTIYDISLVDEPVEDTRGTYAWVVLSNTTIVKVDPTGNIVDKFFTAPISMPPRIVSTGYEWHRIFNHIVANKKTPQLKVSAYFGTETSPVCGAQSLAFPATGILQSGDHLLSFTFNADTTEYSFYVDAVKRDTKYINAQLYYQYENSLYVGATPGRVTALDEEIFGDYNTRITVGDVTIYNYALSPLNIYDVYAEKQKHYDIEWNMNSGTQFYLEEIRRFFKNKIPGSKSQFYNINLVGLQITDSVVREMIEEIITDTVTKIAPAHTKLHRIIWSGE